MATAMLGQGTQLARWNSTLSPPAFEDIDGISNLSGPSASTDQLDVTTLDGSARVFIAGLLEPGEVTFTAFYDPADPVQKRIEDDFTAGTAVDYKITFGSSAAGTETVTFSAIPTTYSLSASADSAVTLDVTLKISGTVTFPT